MSDHDHSWRTVADTELLECDYCHQSATYNQWRLGEVGGQFWPDGPVGRIVFAPGVDLDYETYRNGWKVDFEGDDL